jgi:lipoate-protein ligase A
MFEIAKDPRASASFHMDIDRALVMKGYLKPRLRLYEWNGFSITSGIFSEPALLLNMEQCRMMNVQIAKRPTGGGLLFHGSDLALSVFIPTPLLQGTVEEWCTKINDRVLHALSLFLPPQHETDAVRSHERCRFCMAQVTPFDLVWDGKKIGGCAQRKTKEGLLHQTSIFVSSPDWKSICCCVRDPEDVKQMEFMSVSLDCLVQGAICRKEVQEAIIQSFVNWSIE